MRYCHVCFRRLAHKHVAQCVPARPCEGLHRFGSIPGKRKLHCTFGVAVADMDEVLATSGKGGARTGLSKNCQVRRSCHPPLRMRRFLSAN